MSYEVSDESYAGVNGSCTKHTKIEGSSVTGTMSSKGNHRDRRFRITGSFPGGEIPEPMVVVAPAWIVGGTHVAYGSHAARRLPEELAIRGLVDLDLHDEAAVVQFVSDHGIINKRSSDTDQLIQQDIFFDTPQPNDETMVRITDVQYWLLTAQLLARHCIAARCGEDVLEVWRGWGYRSVDSAKFNYVRFLNRAMSSYSVRLFAEYEIDGEVPVNLDPEVGLFSALCTQLFNIEVANERVNRCERCRGAFVHQLGRSNHQQYRKSGVQYCSKSCANAAAQQKYRERKKAGL
tara:strand:+ start:608 stop:1483 length:876 start_codon:yes stop_codon:yes gene_type:complete